jgi:putative DNA primase/helicase
MTFNATSQQSISAESVRTEASSFFNQTAELEHGEVLQEILDNLLPINFRTETGLADGDNIPQKHFRILTVQKVLETAQTLNCGLCRNQDFIYGFNGAFWQLVDRNELETFLGEAGQKLGVDKITARDYEFKAKLFKQFMADAYLPKPKTIDDKVLINLQNGTYEITKDEMRLRGFSRADFLTYQLSFSYDETATYPKWQAFLDKVLPDASRQYLLAEYAAYVFARHLKLEKTLILYGTGANGKSVVFEVFNALLGKENVSNYSLEALGDNYYRAMIGNKLLNYSSEISNRLQAEKFKQLTSGEPVEARLPYGQPMILTNYARLAFNCNELPKDVEHTKAFFRRFLIIPFDVTIPDEEQNPNLPKEIIQSELSGVFNWLLDGLKRLLDRNRFSPCEASEKMLQTFQRESDSVAMFLSDEGYKADAEDYLQVQDVYRNYRTYCLDNGYKPLGRNNFTKRLETNGVVIERYNVGNVAFLRRTL